MRFNELVDVVDVVMRSKHVPIVIGHAGIGKSQLAKAIASKNGFDVVTLYGSLLKEGELGGLPVLSKLNDDTVINTYTKYCKFDTIDNNHRNGISTILFIDELNRSDLVVQQELMQLINDRQINQYKLPDSCYMIAAGNPEDVGNYQTNVMNDALKDRFIWFNMESSVPDWLQWASKNDNINDDVVDFIADYPEMLHVVNERDEVKPTPRSWQKFSDIIKVKLSDKNKSNITEDDYGFLSSVGKGIIGLEASGSFISFIGNKQDPIPSFENLLSKNKWTDDEIKRKLGSESNPRLSIMVQRIIKKFNEIKSSKNDKVNNYTKGFILILNAIPADLRVATIKDIANNHKEIHDIFIDNNGYMNAYLNILKRL